MAQGKLDTCVICDHPQRLAIDRAVCAGDSLRKISTMFGTGKNAVQRHKNVCMKRGNTPATPTAEPPEYKTAVEVAHNEDIRKYSKGLLGKAISFMNRAEASGDLRTAISAIREAKGCVELLGRLQGDLGPNSAVNVQVNTISMRDSAEWPVFIRIIEKYPAVKAEFQALLECGQ